MKLGPHKPVFVELGWFTGIGAVLALLMGVAAVRLDASKTGTETLRVGIENRLKLLSRRELPQHDRETLEATEAALADWKERASNQPGRIAAVSSASEATGVTLVSFRDLNPSDSEDGLVTTRSHSLRALGEYRQVGDFLDELNDMPGLVGVEDLEMRLDESADDGRVLVSLVITWFAPGVPDAAQREPSQ